METYDNRELPKNGNIAAKSKPPIPLRFSLRALLLLFVPVAILLLTYRWLHEHEYTRKVWHAGLLGVFWGIFVLAIWRGFSYLIRDPNEPNEPSIQDMRTIFLAALLGGFGSASFLALLLWAAKTFA
jgi:hypothetical protein